MEKNKSFKRFLFFVCLFMLFKDTTFLKSPYYLLARIIIGVNVDMAIEIDFVFSGVLEIVYEIMLFITSIAVVVYAILTIREFYFSKKATDQIV